MARAPSSRRQSRSFASPTACQKATFGALEKGAKRSVSNSVIVHSRRRPRRWAWCFCGSPFLPFFSHKICHKQRRRNGQQIDALQRLMGLKFNFSKVPMRWRVLLGLQLGLTGIIMGYRQRVLKVKEQQAKA